jgi:hypothetical protein
MYLKKINTAMVTNTINNPKPEEIEVIKNYIIQYFSDELRNNKSLEGDMERKQLKKWMLQWAHIK